MTCRRHKWGTVWTFDDNGQTNGWYPGCIKCGQTKDVARSLRGLRARARGNAIEREIAHKLGLRRVGQFGGKDDVSGDLFAAQVKSGDCFPERMWTWLKAVPVVTGQTPLLVVTDAPGAGHKRRALVILELDEWAALHAGDGVR